MKPPLKWVGGKQRLLPQLKPLLPSFTGRYIEPFFGGGAMFFDLQPKLALLADANEDLVNFYCRLRDQPDSLIREAQRVFGLEYYACRAELNARGGRTTIVDNRDLIRRAALFLYLNKTCFNGLWRTNKKGEMNVPIGRHKTKPEADWEALEAAATALYGITITCSGFDDTLSTAQAGDFVYLDPPYWLPEGHTAYTKGGFYREDQVALARWLDVLDRRGVKFMLSNSDTDFTRALYQRWNIQTATRGGSVNSDPTKRGPVSELVVRNS